MGVLRAVALFLRALLTGPSALALENLALRQQLAVLRRSVKRPRLRWRDRVFWVWLSRLWRGWQDCLLVVKPETVIRWHRVGFKLYWRRKSRRKSAGRPRIDCEIRDLIRRLKKENPTWGAPRIHSELKLLGYSVGPTTVSEYLGECPPPRPQTWQTFLRNHMACSARKCLRREGRHGRIRSPSV